MRLPRLLVLCALTSLAAGCINSTSLIKVNADGSGTIDHTMLANMAAFKSMMATMGAGGAQAKESSSILNEADFKRMGERMGVRPVSLTPLKEGAFEGAKAIYAFDDITTIRVDQDPQMPGTSGGALSRRPGGGNPIKFTLVRQGTSSVLTISVDDNVTAEATERAQQAPSLDTIDPAMMQMIKTVFDGFHVQIAVEVNGEIIKTNADYVNGARVTLLELDMGRILADDAKLTTLQSKVRPGVSFSELRPLLQEIDGVKVNHPTVTIEFR